MESTSYQLSLADEGIASIMSSNVMQGYVVTDESIVTIMSSNVMQGYVCDRYIHTYIIVI